MTITTQEVRNHLHPFTKNDWYGWAGATPFPKGEGDTREPLISYTEFGVLIVDADGISLSAFIDPEMLVEDAHFMWNIKIDSQLKGYILAHGLALEFFAAKSGKDIADLAKTLGFDPC